MNNHNNHNIFSMKKILLIIIFLPFVAFTQNSDNQIYFRTGDTIHGRSPIYQYQWWSEEWLSDPSNRLRLVVADELGYCGEVSISFAASFPQLHWMEGEVSRYCYTEQPLKIIGIASALYTVPHVYSSRYSPYGYNGNFWDDNPPAEQEYLRLYEADTARNSHRLVGEIEWDYSKELRFMDVDIRSTTFELSATNVMEMHSSEILRGALRLKM